MGHGAWGMGHGAWGIGHSEENKPPIPDYAPAFVRNVLGKMIAREGDDLPVSALRIDGTYPTGTSKWEKRNIAQEIPVWFGILMFAFNLVNA